MPRPAAKRNRVAKTPGPAKKIATSHNSSKNDDRGTRDVSQPPLEENVDASQHAGDNEQQAKNQTPTTGRRDYTTDSTPGGERLGTGSRPPTRARGYSSTLSLGGRKGDSNSRVPGTPAFENSVLGNFRRRPRQPSLMQMMQAEDGASDLDDDDFLADLSPNDESTPLNLARRKSLKTHEHPPSDPGSLSSPSTDGSRKRKRVPEETQVPASPSEIVKDTQDDSALSDNAENEPAASVAPPSLPEYVGPLSQTIAAPMTSSPIASPAHPVSARGPSHLAAAAAEHEDEPHRGTVPMSTAALQGKVLPRRRLRHRKHLNDSDFEVPSDEDDYAELDDDELSRRPTNTSKPQRKQARRSRPLAETGAKSKSKHQKRNPESNAKGPPRIRRTFGKENRVDDEASDSVTSDPESSPPSPSTPGRFMSEELRAQSLKFEEVDKWQMEFEDVTIPGSQASSTG